MLKIQGILRNELILVKREFLNMGNELMFGIRSLINIVNKFNNNSQ